MPGRKNPLVTGEIYHIVNRGLDGRPTFTDKREYKRALQVIYFYQFNSPPERLSKFLLWPISQQKELLEEMEKSSPRLVEIFSYCLMPNHFHFLLRQVAEKGIAKFIAQVENSYTRYFNTRHRRVGLLFLDQFKAVRIESEEQLVHVSRYIHLNPYSSFVVKDLKDLEKYPWSSLSEFLAPEKGGICQKEMILNYFKSPQAYKEFIFDQAAYQRELDQIKHLLLESP